MKRISLLVLLALAAASSDARAGLETNRELVKVFTNFYLQQRDLKSAREYLRDHLRADAADTWGWNLLGITYMQSRSYEKAAEAFGQAVAKSGPGEANRPVYKYNHADALARGGKKAEAIQMLLDIRSEKLVASRVEEALVNLQAGRPLPELEPPSRSSFSGMLSLTAGYDTNVLLSSDSVLSEVDASDTASPFVTPAVQGRWAFDGLGGAMGVAGTASFSYQTSDKAAKFNSLYTALEASWARASQEVDDRYTWRIVQKNEVSFSNQSGFGLFNVVESIGWRADFRHSEASATEVHVPVRYLIYNQAEGESADNDRSGPSLRPTVTHRRQMGKGVLEAGLRLERAFASGVNYVANSAAIPLAWSQPLFADLQGRFSAEAGLTDYPESEKDRTDKFLALGAILGKPVGERFFGALNLGFRRNISSVGTATYSKITGSVVLTYGL